MNYTNEQSSASHVCDELSIEKSILLAIILGDEADAPNNHEDEQNGEEELDQVSPIWRGRSSLQLYKLTITLLRCDEVTLVFSLADSAEIYCSAPEITLTSIPWALYLAIYY